MTNIPSKYWDVPWNPVTGCSPVSLGCDNCWAHTMADRFNKGEFAVTMHNDRLDKIPGGKGKKIFVCNASDLFHPDVFDNFIYAVYRKMKANDQHRYLVLTKRPERYWHLLGNTDFVDLVDAYNHVLYGVTAENQKLFNQRVEFINPDWLSLEPLLSGIDITETLDIYDSPYEEDQANTRTLKWVVVGHESGPKRRPGKLDHVYSLVDQCQNANVPVFVKQIQVDGKLLTKWSDPLFPDDLKIRQKP